MNVPESFFSVNEQLVLFGLSCVFGAVFGVLYDAFRALRIILPHNFWLVTVEDVIFMTSYAVFLPLFASAAARGELRFYFVIGNAIGFVLYFFTVGTVVISALKKLFLIVGRLVDIIIRPFRIIYVFICEKAGLKFVGNSKVLVKSLKKMKTLLLKRRTLLYNRRENKKERT